MEEINTSTAIVKAKKDAGTFLAIGNQLVEKADKLQIVKPEDTQVATIILKDCQTTEQDLEAKRLEITKPINDFVKEVNVLFRETATPILTAKNTVKTKILTYNQEQEKIRLAEEQKRFAEEQARLRRLEAERIERERIEKERREAEEKKLKDEQERLRKLDEERIEKELQAQKVSEEEQKKMREEADKQRLEREKLENEKLEIERQKREAEEERRKIEEEKKLMEEKRIASELAEKKISESRVRGIVKRWSWEIVDEAQIPKAFCSPDSKKINEAIKAGIRKIQGIRIFEASIVR